MSYTLMLYRADGPVKDVNEVIISNFEYWDHGWKRYASAQYLKEFNIEDVKSQIEKELGDKCQVYINYPFGDSSQVPFLRVVTSFAKISEVLPRVHAISAENGLVLYDTRKRRSFFKDLLDDTFITWKMREHEIRENIIGILKWECRRIASCDVMGHKESSFVVTRFWRRKTAVPLEEHVRQFYETLEKSLIEGEELDCENRCFTVRGNGYSIAFCVEAYKKHPQWIGFYENGQPKKDLLRRMGCEVALKWIQECCNEQEKSNIMERMNFTEMADRYKNPGDRFVRSVNIMKQHRKGLFYINYGVPGWHGSAVVFSVVPSKYYGNADRISALILGEETASFILPFVNDVYPYIYERYYDADGNHLPAQMWQKIIEKLFETEQMILHDTFNPQLDSYIEQLELYSDLKDDEESSKIKE